MTDGPHDPRAIANLLLNYADSASIEIKHIALQKLLYFAHESYLMRTGEPLLSGAFEAWQYGPVHPATYQAFKRADDRPINFRAKATDLLTGESREIPLPEESDVCLHVMRVLASYGGLSTSRLIEMSHAPGGPWHDVVHRGGSEPQLGGRITDTVIKQCATAKIRSVHLSKEITETGEPTREDDPTAGHGRSELYRTAE